MRTLPALSVAVAIMAACQPAPTVLPYPDMVEPGRYRVSGVLTEEGVTCPALRDFDGRLFTLTGQLPSGFAPGDTVTVDGRLPEASTCMQGTTIDVRRMVRRQ